MNLPVCVRLWIFRFSDLAKTLPHVGNGHANGFSPVWTRIWLTNLYLALNGRPFRAHPAQKQACVVHSGPPTCSTVKCCTISFIVWKILPHFRPGPELPLLLLLLLLAMLWKCGWWGWWWCEIVVDSGSTHWHCISCLIVGCCRIYRINAPGAEPEFIGKLAKLWACMTKFGWWWWWYGLYSGGPAPADAPTDDWADCDMGADGIWPPTDEPTAPLPMPIRIWCWWYEVNWFSCIAGWVWWMPGNRTGSGVVAAFAVWPAIEKYSWSRFNKYSRLYVGYGAVAAAHGP